MKLPAEFGWTVYGEDPIGIAVRGEIDLDSAPKLADAIGELIQRGYQRVALDLGAVEFMDSTGIRVLVDMHGRLRDADGELVLQAASAPVRRVLALTGIDRLLPLVDEADSPPTASGPPGSH
jgi:anti-anti-sigma factor